MKNWNFLRITCITLLLFSCDNPKIKVEKTSAIEKVNDSIEKKVIKEVLNAMWKAIENEDVNEYAKYVHPNFTQFGEYDSILREGKQAEVNGVQGWIEESKNIQTEMLEPKVTINGNTAWIVYYWSDKGTTNGEPFATKGKSTRIFVKENGSWLCIHGHYTLLP